MKKEERNSRTKPKRRWKRWLLLLLLVALALLLFRFGQGASWWGMLSGQSLSSTPESPPQEQKESAPKTQEIELKYEEDKFYLGSHICSSSPKKLDETLLRQALQKLRSQFPESPIVVRYQKNRKTPVRERDRALRLIEAQEGFRLDNIKY